MIATCNGSPILSLRLSLPPVGNWVAEVDVDSDTELTGPIEIADEAVTYTGVVAPGRSGLFVGHWRAYVVGGAGGLAQDVEARSYQRVTAMDVVSDLLGTVGETLSAASTRAALSQPLTYWTRSAGRASVALTALCEALGARWRVLPSGEVWVGTETWPDVAPPLELDRDDPQGSRLLAPDTLELVPGVSLDGFHVGRVEHTIEDNRLRTTVWADS